jgi:hypothetical protein
VKRACPAIKARKNKNRSLSLCMQFDQNISLNIEH